MALLETRPNLTTTPTRIPRFDSGARMREFLSVNRRAGTPRRADRAAVRPTGAAS